MRRGRSTCWPLAAAALFLLLVVGFSHCVAAARPLPLQPAAAGLVLQQGEEAASNGSDEFSGISEMMGGGEEAEPAVACAEDNDDECLQRRLLGDAHLDYIYTQHKGKP